MISTASFNWVRGQGAFFQQLLRPAALALSLCLAGCISPVDYGKIPHSEFVAHSRCSPGNEAKTIVESLPYFVVTSRLPDCRTSPVKLLHHRGDVVRFGRFGWGMTAERFPVHAVLVNHGRQAAGT